MGRLSAGEGTRAAAERLGRKDARRWNYQFITGIDTASLLKLLWRNRFRVSLRYLRELSCVGGVSVFTGIFGLWESLTYGQRVEETEIVEHPIFVLGHWRSGTTFLHKLLALDERHTYPTLYQCALPNCFLSFEGAFKRWVTAKVPKQRPMDNVRLGADEPFEDEFALLKTTQISPMLSFVFPRSSWDYEADCDLSTIPERDRERWKKALVQFLKKITLRTGKRIVLKSPGHSFRIRTLLSLFPDARFVCIVRDPYSTFASNVRLWKRLTQQNRLQAGGPDGVRDLIFYRYMRMFRALERDRGCIPEGHFCQVRFEELEADPVGTVGRVYGELGLSDFEPLRPKLEAYLERNGDYSKNTYEFSAEEKEEIYRRWEPAFTAYGYDK